MYSIGQIPDDLVVQDIVDEHFQEAGFLWRWWDDKLAAPDITLADLARMEQRIFAHVDALVIGGKSVEDRLLDRITEASDAEGAFAAAAVLLSSANPAHAERVVGRLRRTRGEIRYGLRRALELAPRGPSLAAWVALYDSDRAEKRAAAIAIMALRGVESIPLRADEHPSPAVLEALLRAAPSSHGEPYRLLVGAALQSPVVSIRDAALEAGLVLGLPAAWETCTGLVKSREGDLRTPLLLAALLGGEREVEAIRLCAEIPGLRQSALRALGFTGRLQAAEACVDAMRDPASSRLAGEAFSHITGLDLRRGGFVAEADGGTAGKEPEGQIPTPESSLPVPEAGRVAEWWRTHRSRFRPRMRYLLGRPLGLDTFAEALERSSMRCREALAIEAAIRTRGSCLIQTRTWACHQQRQGQALRETKTWFSENE